jgi:hypothetical protein
LRLPIALTQAAGGLALRVISVRCRGEIGTGAAGLTLPVVD